LCQVSDQGITQMGEVYIIFHTAFAVEAPPVVPPEASEPASNSEAKPEAEARALVRAQLKHGPKPAAQVEAAAATAAISHLCCSPPPTNSGSAASAACGACRVNGDYPSAPSVIAVNPAKLGGLRCNLI
jgi:hypothetical protein